MKFYALLTSGYLICTGDDNDDSIKPTVQGIKDHGWDQFWENMKPCGYKLVEIDLEKDTVEILDWKHYK